jgi:flagellar motor switch protein FliM
VLSGAVRAPVEMQLIAVDHVPVCDLAPGLECPTCCALIQAEPLRGPLLLEVGPRIAFPLLDRLLGGAATRTESAPPRAPTEVESKLLMRVVELLLAAWRKAWSGVCELRTVVTAIESDPRRLQFVSPSESVVLLTFDVSLGDVHAGLNLAIPHLALPPVHERLVTYHRSIAAETRLTEKSPAGGAPEGLIEVAVSLAATRLTAHDMQGLEVGDVIVTDCGCAEPVRVTVDGRLRFAGLPGQFQGRKAVRIVEAAADLE